MSRNKSASSQVAWALLTEGVTEARVNMHRLRLMCDRVEAMIEGSEARDHLHQVAGDIIQALPEALDDAERALDRTSYALSVMGEDFLRGRISLDDRERVDGSLKAAPFASVRDKSSARVAERFRARRVADRFLTAKGVAPSAEHYFFDNPEKREVGELYRSDAISNKPGVATKAVEDSDSPDRTVAEARSEAEKAPPTPNEVRQDPGGKAFSTLNRFIIETEEPGVTGVPDSRAELPRSPKDLKKARHGSR